MPMISILGRYDRILIRKLLLISAIGFIAHIVLAIVISPMPQSDALDYHEHALRLANTFSYTSHGMPTAYRPVGFPAVLSIAYMLSPSMIAGFILQSLFMSISGLMIALILKEYHASDRYSIVALIIYLLLPMSWVQSMTFMSEPLAIMSMLIGIYLRIIHSSTQSRCMEGVFWGIAILTRPIMIFSVLGIIIIDMLKDTSKKLPIMFISGCVLILLPWMARNAIVMNSPMIASNTGINLLIGHNPESNGSYKFVEDMHRFDALSEIEANSSAMKSALDNILNDPFHSIALIPKKIAFLFASDAYLPMQIIHVEGNSYREKMHNLPWWSALLIVPGALLIFFGLSHGKVMFTLPESTFHAAIIFGMIIPCAIFFGTARYHEPMIPFFLIAFMLGMERQQRIFGGTLVLSFALLMLWFIEYAMIFLF